MIKVGETIPAATLMEYSEVEGEGCSIGPNPVDVVKASAGKTIALFALPGAFTPTCSAKHVPGYVEKFDELNLCFAKILQTHRHRANHLGRASLRQKQAIFLTLSRQPQHNEVLQ